MLFSFLSQHYTPKRMVIAGVGVEHERLVDVAEKYFIEQAPIWETEKELFTSPKDLSIDESIAQYTGGFVQVFQKML